MPNTEIPEDVREAGRTAFLRHKGLTGACVDAAIDAAVVADRASRAPDPSRDGLVEALRFYADKANWREQTIAEDAKLRASRLAQTLEINSDGIHYRASAKHVIPELFRDMGNIARKALSAIEATK